jgi:cephalosporin hydroxylase
MLSIIIPSLNEELYLNKTILNILENAEDKVEILAVLDGWEPVERLDHRRVIYIKHQERKGQRASINEAARIAAGDYIMKLDAHCAVGKGFDRILIRDCEYDMTMIPAMFNLDVVTWKPKYFENWGLSVRNGKLNPYMYIGWKDGHMRSLYYPGAIRKKMYEKGKDKQIDETMTCMGPGFFMHKKRFFELGGCDEGHGQWGQQGVEVACKAWLSGGSLMTNKNTWFAHFFRGGNVPEGHKKGFPYRLSQKAIDAARTYSEDLWLNNKWEKQTRTMQWLVDKFTPPTWENKMDDTTRMDIFAKLYNHIHRRKNDCLWRGVPLWKFPTDLSLYHEVIHEKKPDTIVEIGTAKGGSSLYFADMLDLCNPGGKVITIDVRDRLECPKDKRINYIIADSSKRETAQLIKDLVTGKVMVTVDGNHGRKHVKWDLHNYSPLVTPGQYLVVEDCYTDRGLFGPGEAKEWFLKNYKNFIQTDRCERYMVGMTMDGWLLRK